MHATFDAKAGQYAGRWFDEKFKKADDEHARAERIFDTPDAAKADAIARAQAIAAKCLGKPGVVEEESKPRVRLTLQARQVVQQRRGLRSRFAFFFNYTRLA